VLDVSSNDLVDEIPTSLSNRTAIEKGVFPSPSFGGNPSLCGLPLPDYMSNVKLGLIIGVAIAGAEIALLGALIWLCPFSKHQKKINPMNRSRPNAFVRHA
jgi:hypothetical protein